MAGYKKVLLGITGSIAAYKSPLIVRQLIKSGTDVQVIATPSALDFVSPLTLSTLSKKPVLKDLFAEESWSNHVLLGRWADVMLIAPLSCNTLSKMASGLCDNLLMATYLSATCPVVVAPAMDADMWNHPTTKNNLEILHKHGCHIIQPEWGELASGLVGDGRMAEPETIISFLNDFFERSAVLNGKKALVTAGPTYEAIDPVRFIGNRSSGKMGIAIATELKNRGADVTLVAGPIGEQSKLNGIKIIHVQSAAEMYNACMDVSYDIAVMAAAVADYTPETPSLSKIKKKEKSFQLSLEKTKDILKQLGEKKRGNQILVGFALETDNERDNARKKLTEKNADLIVLNSLKDEGAGFEVKTNKATFFYKNGKEKVLELKLKTELAKDIVDEIIELIK